MYHWFQLLSCVYMCFRTPLNFGGTRTVTFLQVKIVFLFFLPVIKTFYRILNSLRLCACDYFIDLMTAFFLLLPPFYKKAIKSIE